MKRLAATVLLLVSTAFGQDNSKAIAQAWRDNPIFQPFVATVKLTISAGDLEPEISSYVTRELRSLKGLEIVETLQDHEINIVAMGVPREKPQIVALSYLFTSVLFAEKQKGLQRALAANMWPTFKQLYGEVHRIEDFAVETFGVSMDLKQQCQRLIAQFDAKIIEPRRKAHEDLREKIKKVVDDLEGGKP